MSSLPAFMAIAILLIITPAAELASMCAAGRCNEVSDELRALLTEKRDALRRRIEEMRFLDQRMPTWPVSSRLAPPHAP